MQKLKSVQEEGDEWNFKQLSLVKTSETTFIMGKQFEEMSQLPVHSVSFLDEILLQYFKVPENLLATFYTI